MLKNNIAPFRKRFDTIINVNTFEDEFNVVLKIKQEQSLYHSYQAVSVSRSSATTAAFFVTTFASRRSHAPAISVAIRRANQSSH